MERPSIVNRYLTHALILTLIGSVFSLALPSTLMFHPSYASHENISVELDDTEYRQDYDVTITGSIDERADNEDQVTIKVKEPDGSTDADEDVTLSSHDEFDLVYSISGSADDGVYTVEVDYDNEKTYSFFIVDEDDDTVTVETDHDSYNGGDDVKITGKVDEVVTGEDEVEITIIDPNNVKIANREPATLGEGSGVDDDGFKFTFKDLDNDADHGRYAVIVKYDSGDQQGFTIFTVEESSSGGNDNISADLNKDSYDAGDTVTLTGNIDNVDNNLDLEIVAKDPSNHIIGSDDSVNVASDGDFEFEFDLDNDADDGEYTIAISYGSDDLELTFDVGGGGGSTASKVTVKLSKSSFLAGESITVTGTVPKLVSDEEVSILVYDKSSVFAGSAKYVEPKSDKTYTATLKLKSDLEVADGYEVRVDYNGEEVVAKFTITGQIAASDVLTVKTDKPKYPVDSTVKISGKVSADLLVEGKQLFLQVYNPEQVPYRFTPVDVEDDGSYSYPMVVGPPYGIGGVWQVKATYNEKQVKTTFEITGGKASYNLKAAGQSYAILYDITNGQIKSMFVNENEKKLVIAIDASEDGQITLVLPRVVIDAVQNDKDTKYFVSTTDIDGGASAVPNLSESEATEESRTVVIDYTKGTDLIEISGTSVVPEFGSISVIIFAAAIVAVILVTARFSSKSDGNDNGKFFNAITGQ